MNKQDKKKYGINPNSTHGSKDGDEYHFGHYHPSHETWEKGGDGSMMNHQQYQM